MSQLFAHRYSPTSSAHAIVYPDGESEFEVHARIYLELLQRGFDVRGEVPFTFPDGRRCRLDLVVFDQGKATHIIEVKAGRKQFDQHSHKHTRQPTRYRLLGVPVTFVYGHLGADELLKEFESVRPEIKIPLVKMVKFTAEMLKEILGCGNINAKQAEILKVTLPMSAGWKSRIIGRMITTDDWERLKQTAK